MEARLIQDSREFWKAGWYALDADNRALHETIATLLAERDRLRKAYGDLGEEANSLRAELSRERERHQDLRQVVKEYRNDDQDHTFCPPKGIYGACACCSICKKADSLLEPHPAPVDTGGTTATE